MTLFKDDPDFQQMEEKANSTLQTLLEATLKDYEAYDADKAAAAAEMSALLKQAKEQGINVKAFRKLVAERKRDRADLEEEQSAVELYRELLL